MYTRFPRIAELWNAGYAMECNQVFKAKESDMDASGCDLKVHGYLSCVMCIVSAGEW